MIATGSVWTTVKTAAAARYIHGRYRTAIGDDVPAGLVLVTVAADGSLHARTGPPRPSVAGGAVQIDVVLDSAADLDLTVAV